MNRVRRLVIRLSQEEFEAVDRMARARRLPISTLARVLLLQETDKQDLSVKQGRIQVKKEAKRWA